MYTYDPRELSLWEKIKPYLEGCKLKENAPKEIVEASKELKKIAWELGQ